MGYFVVEPRHQRLLIYQVAGMVTHFSTRCLPPFPNINNKTIQVPLERQGTPLLSAR